jgi:hypothetical protein
VISAKQSFQAFGKLAEGFFLCGLAPAARPSAARTLQDTFQPSNRLGGSVRAASIPTSGFGHENGL